MTLEPFPERMHRLAREQGTSLARMYDRVRWAGPGEKPAKSTFDQAMTGRRPKSAPVLLLAAAMAGVHPTEFPEYRLLLARIALDEDVVGLDEACALLARIEDALGNVPARAAELVP